MHVSSGVAAWNPAVTIETKLQRTSADSLCEGRAPPWGTVDQLRGKRFVGQRLFESHCHRH